MSSKLVFATVLALGTAVFVGACGDDDTTTPAADASVADGSADATATDAGADGATADAGCQTCGDLLQNGGNRQSCESANNYIRDTFTCACDPNACATQCGNECRTGERPGDTCVACLQTKCAAEIQACISDDGTYRPRDAGAPARDGGAADAGVVDAGR
jgi:hypothetical protein